MLQAEEAKSQEDETNLVPLRKIVEVMGIKRGNLYHYMLRLGIKPQKVVGDSYSYVTTEECERLMQARRKNLALKREWEHKKLVLEP